jgi:hypothetical protein
MTRLILHAGMPKTGTTAIQSIAARNRNELYEKGVCYPESWAFFGKRKWILTANAHFSLFGALEKGRPLDEKNLARFKEYLENEVPRDMTILLSAESMNRHVSGGAAGFRARRKDYLARLADYFQEFQAEIVLYFREPTAFAESMYSEGVLSSEGALTFEEALDRYLKRFQYAWLRDSYAKHFKVSCHSFEDQKSDLVGNFFKVLDLPVPSDTTETAQRVGIPKPAVLWMFRVKNHMKDQMTREERLSRWLFALQAENADIFRSDERCSFWPDPETRATFRDKMLEGFEDIHFAPLSPVAPQCTWDEAQHEAAERRFLEWQASHAEWLHQRAEAGIAPFVNPQYRAE